MAAVDQLEEVIRGITKPERDALAGFIKSSREDLFAARSEDARVRIADEFVRRVHEMLLRQSKKG
jgi:hypothetical protein